MEFSTRKNNLSQINQEDPMKSPSFWDTVKQVVSPITGRNKLWDKARFVLADVPLDKKEARKILPFGMWLPDNPVGTLFITDYPKTSFTVPYKEAALLIHVKTPLGRGIHCPWMLVDDDTAMIYGRELLGYPKKLADIQFQETEGAIEAGVKRRDIDVLAMTAKPGNPVPSPPPVLGEKTFNVGGMGNFFALQPIWFFKPREIIHEYHSADVSVTVNPSPFDPISHLVDGEPFNGRMAVIDILGSYLLLPVGLAAFRWFFRSYFMRYR